MSLSIIKRPPTFSFAENDCIFQIQRSPFPPPNSNFSYQLFIPTTLQGKVDAFFTLRIFGVDHRFSFVAIPDWSGYQLRWWETGQSLGGFIAATVARLSFNYLFFKFFSVISSANFFLFTARYPGENYAISLVDHNIDGLHLNTATSGSISKTPDDYKIYFCLRSHAEIVCEELVPIDSDRIATVNFSSYIRPHLKPSFTLGFVGQYLHTVHNGLLRSLFYFSEFFSSNPATEPPKIRSVITDLLPHYFLPGGLSLRDQKLLSLSGNDFFPQSAFPYRFLTSCPNEKLTYPGVPERLYFLYPELQQSFTSYLTLIAYYNSHPTFYVTLESLDPEVKVSELYCSLNDILPQLPFPNPYKYDIFLYLNADITERPRPDRLVSEIRTFILADTPVYKQRTFVFRNSFGFFDTLVCTGELSVSDELNRDIAEIITDRIYTLTPLDTNNLPVFKCNTGWFEEAKYRYWLEDFLLSKDVSWLIDDVLYPIVISTTKAEKQRDKEFLFNLSFEFTFAQREHHHSALSNNLTF